METINHIERQRSDRGRKTGKRKENSLNCKSSYRFTSVNAITSACYFSSPRQQTAKPELSQANANIPDFD